MSKLNTLVVFGGSSSEHEISQISVNLILNNLSADKYNIIPLYITKEGKWFLYDGPLKNVTEINIEKAGTRAILSPDREQKGLLRLVGDKFKIIPVDVAIPVLHGKNGEDGTIQGLFELAGIPYVGCNVLTSAISMDKEFTKKVVRDMGTINQAKSLIFNSYDIDTIDDFVKKAKEELGYPIFIKPANAGSSVGIHRAINKKELLNGIEDAFLYDSKIILEEEIIGRELECAVFGVDNKIFVSEVGEILAAGEFYDFDSKYNSKESKTQILEEINGDRKIIDEIRNQAKEIFQMLNGKGLSRIDFFLEKGTNKIIFNEINTFPGFTDISMYPMLMENAGYSPKVIIDQLIKIALA